MQVREAAARILRVAKESGIAVFLVGHVTKEGAIAGPASSSTSWTARFISRAIATASTASCERSRTASASTNELGVFEMTGAGLEGVADPSACSAASTRPRPARRRLHPRRNAAAPPRDPGPGLSHRPRYAAACWHRSRSEALDDRGRARPPRRRGPRRQTSSSTWPAASASTSLEPTSGSRSRSPRRRRVRLFAHMSPASGKSASPAALPASRIGASPSARSSGSSRRSP